MEATKTCKKCKVEKAVSEFEPRCITCRECRNRKKVLYLLEHPEATEARTDCARRWRKNHPKQCIEATIRWQKKNQDKVKEYKKNHKADQAVYNSRWSAKRRGGLPCSSPVEEIKQSFTGKCHACGTGGQEVVNKLRVDHDHTTGKFRGWLCGSCNLILGHAKDSKERLAQLAAYLDKNAEPSDNR